MCKVYNWNRWCALTNLLWLFCRELSMGLEQLLERILKVVRSYEVARWQLLTATQFFQNRHNPMKIANINLQWRKPMISHHINRFRAIDHHCDNAKCEYRDIVLAWIVRIGFESLIDVHLISYHRLNFYALMFASFILICYMLAAAKYVNVSWATEVLGG